MTVIIPTPRNIVSGFHNSNARRDLDFFRDREGDSCASGAPVGAFVTVMGFGVPYKVVALNETSS